MLGLRRPRLLPRPQAPSREEEEEWTGGAGGELLQLVRGQEGQGESGKRCFLVQSFFIHLQADITSIIDNTHKYTLNKMSKEVKLLL